MPTSYTSLLNLALPVTGELSGTWGDTVNDYITKYVDSSVAGTQTISGTQTAVTLTRASGASLSPVGSGSTGSSQYAIINCTGSPASTLTITVDVSTGSPTLSNSTYSQTFAVINATSTSQSVVVRATTTSGTSTGVTMVSGERALIAWSGSDFTKIATSVADGVTTFSAGTTGFTPSTATSGAVTLAGTLATANGGTNLTSFTANGLLYASSTSALTTGSAISFDGTNFATTGTASATKFIPTGGSATGNGMYLSTTNTLAWSTNGAQVMTLNANGRLLVGGTSEITATANAKVQVSASDSTAAVNVIRTSSNPGYLNFGAGSSGDNVVDGTNLGRVWFHGFHTSAYSFAAGIQAEVDGTPGASNDMPGRLIFQTSADGAATATERMRITAAGFTRPVAYADTVVAAGNTGTALTLTCTQGNVFTATLTGNATITLASPIATGSSSLTLILTNDGTAGRTVAWAGGSFVFPGGAASLSRTTTANAVDIWVFFTPDGGTTWYGNIAMKNMTA